jgi:cell division protein FtsQ
VSALRQLVLWLVALALVIAPGVAVFNGWIASERWPLKRLWIEAEFVQIDEQAVRDAVLPYLDRGFFAVSPEQLRQAVLALPWVAHAEVRKRWPDVLEIRLVERRAVARWGTGQLLSDRGDVFEPEHAQGTEALPQLIGPQTRLRDLVEFHRLSSTHLAPYGLMVRRVELSPRGSWSLTLDDQSTLLLGRTDPESRVARFAALLPRLRQEGRAIVRADLRHADGLAMRWGEPLPTAPQPAAKVVEQDT